MGKRLKEQSTRLKVAKALESARDAERVGLEAIARIAEALGAKDMPAKIEVSPMTPGAAGQPFIKAQAAPG